MPRICKVTLNKETFYANVGDLLLDGAIMNGIPVLNPSFQNVTFTASCTWRGGAVCVNWPNVPSGFAG